MGIFADLHKAEGAYIPEDKKEEFKERLEKVFQASGMMDSEYVSFFGTNLMLMHKAKMHDYGMDFTYNYFEDDFWENAGYSMKNNYVWSNKIGCRKFAKGVLAAYTLEGLYTEGTSFITFDGDWYFEDFMIGWINYLFDEKLTVKNRNVWKMCEIAHYENEFIESDMKEDSLEYFSDIFQYDDAALSRHELQAVYDGINTVETETDAYLKESGNSCFVLFAYLFRNMLDELRRRKENNVDEADIDEVIRLLETFYGSDISEEDFIRMCKDKGLENFGVFTSKFDLPVFAVKIEAENYDKDFWTLWERVRGTINGSKRAFPGFGGTSKPEYPYPTKAVFKISYDDMIPYWTEGSKIYFSGELEEWFREIKKKYDAIVESDMDIPDNKLKWIIETLNYASMEYYRIYAFADFFYETIDNLSDKRYIALWKLFEDMLHDPKMQKAGKVIFKKDDDSEPRSIIDYTDSEYGSYHRLKGTWGFMLPDEKFNKARKTFRWYMALVANKELRNKVFGF